MWMFEIMLRKISKQIKTNLSFALILLDKKKTNFVYVVTI